MVRFLRQWSFSRPAKRKRNKETDRGEVTSFSKTQFVWDPWLRNRNNDENMLRGGGKNDCPVCSLAVRRAGEYRLLGSSI